MSALDLPYGISKFNFGQIWHYFDLKHFCHLCFAKIWKKIIKKPFIVGKLATII